MEEPEARGLPVSFRASYSPGVSVEDLHLLLPSPDDVRVAVTDMAHVVDTVQILQKIITNSEYTLSDCPTWSPFSSYRYCPFPLIIFSGSLLKKSLQEGPMCFFLKAKVSLFGSWSVIVL